MKSHKDLEIYQLAFKLADDIRILTLKLSNTDKYEVGSQIRRSSQSIKDNIVEGYGRRRYKGDFIKFLTYSYASLLEATSQAEFVLKFTNEKEAWDKTIAELNKLGKKIYSFIKYVENEWKT